MPITVTFTDAPPGGRLIPKWRESRSPIVEVDHRQEVRKGLQPYVARFAGKIGSQSAWILGCLEGMRENGTALQIELAKNKALESRRLEGTEIEGKYARIRKSAEKMASLLESLGPHELKSLYEKHKCSTRGGELGKLYEERPGSRKLGRVVSELVEASGELYVMSEGTGKAPLAGKIQTLVHSLKHICELSGYLERDDVPGYFDYLRQLEDKGSKAVMSVLADADIKTITSSIDWRRACGLL